MAPFDKSYTTFYWLAVVGIPGSSILYDFRLISRWMILWPWNLGYRSLKAIETGTVRKIVYRFVFAFHSNYGSILYHFRDKARYWSKIAIFIRPLHSAPTLGGLRRNQSINQSVVIATVLYGQTRIVWLPDGEKKFEDMIV